MCSPPRRAPARWCAELQTCIPFFRLNRRNAVLAHAFSRSTFHLQVQTSTCRPHTTVGGGGPSPVLWLSDGRLCGPLPRVNRTLAVLSVHDQASQPQGFLHNDREGALSPLARAAWALSRAPLPGHCRARAPLRTQYRLVGGVPSLPQRHTLCATRCRAMTPPELASLSLAAMVSVMAGICPST